MGTITSTASSNEFDSARGTNPDGTTILVLSEKKLRRFPRTEKSKDSIEVEICGIHQSSTDSGDNDDSTSLFQPKKSTVVSDDQKPLALSGEEPGMAHFIYLPMLFFWKDH